MSNTKTTWTAYRVFYNPPCQSLEVIGYFQNMAEAELAKCSFIEKRKLKIDGICCSNSKYVEVEEIAIE